MSERLNFQFRIGTLLSKAEAAVWVVAEYCSPINDNRSKQANLNSNDTKFINALTFTENMKAIHFSDKNVIR